MFWLATPDDIRKKRYIKRFDPRYWTINFPRPMMAAIVGTAPGEITVPLVFYQNDDLAGLIWDSVDTIDHPLLRYETSKDYSGLTLSFRWRSLGTRQLDELHGPTLTIEGRDSEGAARAWFVRLWNYADGDPDDAIVTIDFDVLDGGFILPSEADPVDPGDVDRMFVSMVPPSYDGSTGGPIELSPGVYERVEGQVTISDVVVTGGGSSLSVGDIFVRPHALRLANGYDDTFNVTPWRVIHNAVQLGYRDWINHYVGMSHYYTLAWDVAESRFIVDPSLPSLNIATAAWHQSFMQMAAEYDFDVILSLSYELFAENVPAAWQQRTKNGDPALTGWSPPSSLVAPANQDVLDYLRDVFTAFADIADGSALPVHMQIGEPWWWYQLDTKEPCFYDDVTEALYVSETGNPVPARHASIFEIPDASQQSYLDWLGEKLGASTIWLRDEIKSAFPGASVMLLFYTPQVLNTSAPMLASANFPATSWTFPAFDRLQIEDYDYVIAGDWRARGEAIAYIDGQLGYPRSRTHYFSGFNLLAETSYLWTNIDLAIDQGRAQNFDEVFVWAYSQIVRDGFVYAGYQEVEMSGFHEVRFPDDIGFGSSGGPGFMTTVVEVASGHEQRNMEWSQARAQYDIGAGLRNEGDLGEIIAFFRARKGRAFGFRFKDWTDYRSGNIGEDITPDDQEIGIGDDTTTEYALIKTYQSGTEGHVRFITKPVDGSVVVALDGTLQASGWTLDSVSGVITFDTPPGDGVVITAGFEFDVPVRFRDDHLSVSIETFKAGDVPSIGLVEVRI